MSTVPEPDRSFGSVREPAAQLSVMAHPSITHIEDDIGQPECDLINRRWASGDVCDIAAKVRLLEYHTTRERGESLSQALQLDLDAFVEKSTENHVPRGETVCE